MIVDWLDDSSRVVRVERWSRWSSQVDLEVTLT